MAQLHESDPTRGRIRGALRAAKGGLIAAAVVALPGTRAAAQPPEPPAPEIADAITLERGQVPAPAATLDAPDGNGPAAEIGDAVAVRRVQPGDSIWKIAQEELAARGVPVTNGSTTLEMFRIIAANTGTEHQGNRDFDVRLTDGRVTSNPADPDLLNVGDSLDVSPGRGL